MTEPTVSGAAAEGSSAPGAAAPAPAHWTALDGLRGLAVSAVVAYHLGNLRGGFLGVDLFFVLSGFLITSLMLRERARTGTISLRRFWERRARRLLPALAVTLVGVLVFARVWFDPRRLPGLRWDAIAAAAYVANWRFARLPLGGYFAPDPSPLRHTWSLGIEEQFYLLWPVLVLGILLVARRRRVGVAVAIGLLAGLGAVTSTAWMIVHADAWSIDRLYLGTDTRAAAPLLGALLACVLHPWTEAGRSLADGPRRVLGVVGALAVAGLTVAVFAVAPDDAWLYRGGFTALALLGCVAVAAGVLAGGGLVGALSIRPLRWLGERSYGIYLYSWPIQMFARDRGYDGLALVAITVALTGVLAVVSYRWIEMPVRHRSWPPARPAWVVSVGTATAVTFALILALTATSAQPDPLATKSTEDLQAEALKPAVTVPPTTAGPSTSVAPGSSVPLTPVRVMVAGDSVGYTLGKYAPKQIEGVSSIDARSLVGCSLLISGPRPAEAVKLGAPATYDGCAVPIDDSDALGLQGQPDVVLLVTGPWERNDHERFGRTVGPGDAEWEQELRALLATRIDRLTSNGARVALWAEPCSRTTDERRRERWFVDEVLRPVAEDRPDTVVIDGSDLVCSDGRARTDIADVGDPRPDDGQHWSPDGAAWLWSTWLGEELAKVGAGPG